jgi:hypothetical protein
LSNVRICTTAYRVRCDYEFLGWSELRIRYCFLSCASAVLGFRIGGSWHGVAFRINTATSTAGHSVINSISSGRQILDIKEKERKGCNVGNFNEGAKEARREIKRFQQYINSPHLVPDQCYRMASATYSLVCYVNQVTALYLSKNYTVIPIFLKRSYDALLETHHARVSEPYRSLVIQYLSHIAHFLVDYSCLGQDTALNVEFIPHALLELSPMPLPENLSLENEF